MKTFKISEKGIQTLNDINACLVQIEVKGQTSVMAMNNAMMFMQELFNDIRKENIPEESNGEQKISIDNTEKKKEDNV